MFYFSGMARPLRIDFPGGIYHVTSRGNAKAEIFCDDADRRAFLEVVADSVERFNWLCHAYCLMANHYHLLIETPEGNLSQGMRQINSVYSQRFNRRHGRVGHLFQGRFKSILVDRQAYLLELCRYIVLNPVRAGIVDDPAKYPWSSYQGTADRRKRPEFLAVDWLLSQFSSKTLKAEQEYRSFVQAGVARGAPWEELKGQCLLGGEDFVARLIPLLKDKSALTEVPRRQRYLHRPALDEILPGALAKPERNAAIAVAHLGHGYTQQQIAKHCRLHYSTVSRIIQQSRRSKRAKSTI